MSSPVVRGALVLFDADGGAQLDEILAQVALVAAGREVVHEVGEAVGDRVELVLHRLIGSGLTVLERVRPSRR